MNRRTPRRTTTTPLRKDNSYENLTTPPRVMSAADLDDISPHSFYRPQSAVSPYYDREDLRQLSSTPQFGVPRNLFAQENPTFKSQTREDRMRALRQDAMSNYLPGTACFIGEKLMVSTETMNDIYHLALSYYQQHQYERALEVLNKKQTLNKSVLCRYLAALCSIALENGRDALDYLGHKNPFSGKDLFQDETQEGCIKLESVMCFARGKAYLLIKEIDNARDCFKEALMVDTKCYDALDALVKYNMMEEKAEWDFVMSLPYADHCGVDADYIQHLYGLKLKKDILNGIKMDSDLEIVAKSLDVQLSIAEGYFSESRFEECLKICKEIKAQDPFFQESIPLYLSCLYELGLKNELYEYSQELVDRLNDEAVAWHAVGLYYLYIKKNLEARRYFSQALTINQFFQQSWLGYGHSFSAEKDHDQAINAYLTCSKLIPGSYLPLMYVAMQYMEQNKMAQAHEYFMRSLQKSTHDPFLYNELAVYHYKEKEYKEAREYLHKALRLAQKRQCQSSPIWEKVWCNLGHVYRHPPLLNYDRALKCFENALVRNPKNSDARATVGMIYQLQGNTARAILEYNEALNHTDAGGLVNELLDVSLHLNFNTHYATTAETETAGRLDDAFNIFEMAESITATKDVVGKELDESNWNDQMDEENSSSSVSGFGLIEEEVIRSSLESKSGGGSNNTSFTKTDDELIMDEGDLRSMTEMTKKNWI